MVSRRSSGKPFQCGMPGAKSWVRSTNDFVLRVCQTSESAAGRGVMRGTVSPSAITVMPSAASQVAFVFMLFSFPVSGVRAVFAHAARRLAQHAADRLVEQVQVVDADFGGDGFDGECGVEQQVAGALHAPLLDVAGHGL